MVEATLRLNLFEFTKFFSTVLFGCSCCLLFASDRHSFHAVDTCTQRVQRRKIEENSCSARIRKICQQDEQQLTIKAKEQGLAE